ncbi:MAG: hypothetical protein NC110_01710 [Ruminococcus sp.]|nr:hypothetical protein [Ruminococcus sp.]
MSSVEQNTLKILGKSGIAMSLVEGEKLTAFRAFIQPLRYKNKLYIDKNVTELRYENTRRFLLLSPPNVDISGADGRSSFISDGNQEYAVNHSELIMLGNKPMYRWSIIHFRN